MGYGKIRMKLVSDIKIDITTINNYLSILFVK